MKLFLQEIDDVLNSHITSYGQSGYEGKGSSWLRNHHDGVDECVGESGESEGSKEQGCKTVRWIG